MGRKHSIGGQRSPIGLFPGQAVSRLYDRVVDVLRVRRYGRRTEEAYVHWIRRFLLFHRPKHPRELREGDVNRFLTDLAIERNVAASTQNQALAVVLFLYEHVLEQPLNRIEGVVVRARRPKRLPVVLSREEVEALQARLKGVAGLVCALLYGTGMRLFEGLGLRVKDDDDLHPRMKSWGARRIQPSGPAAEAGAARNLGCLSRPNRRDNTAGAR